jgi:hypothetical protein
MTDRSMSPLERAIESTDRAREPGPPRHPPPTDADAPEGAVSPVRLTEVSAPPQTVRLLTVEDLANLPEPTWLVDGWVPEHGLSVIYGPSGSFKSFLALAWSLHVASGTPWFGREVVHGPAVYLSLEGGYGLRQRIEAWRTDHPDADLSGFRAVVASLSLLEEPTVDALKAAIGEAVVRPASITIDTLSRAMQGGDENSPADIGKIIVAVDQLIGEWDTSALIVHHTGHGDKGRERGHSALPAAADCRIGLTRTGTRVKVDQVKAKDAEEQAPITLARRIVTLPGLDQHGRERTSMVLDYVGTAAPTVVRDDAAERCEAAVLAALSQAGEPMSKNQIAQAVDGFGAEAQRAAIDSLTAAGRIEQHKQGRAHLCALPSPNADLTLTDDPTEP